jgi:heat shock protein HslJ
MTQHDDTTEAGMAGREALVGAWQLEAIGAAGAAGDVTSTVTFAEDGQVRGGGGVNRFGGPYRVEGDIVELGPLFSTRMAGPEPAMDQERRFLAALSGRRPFATTSGAPVIGEGVDEVHLRRLPEDPDQEPPADEAG